MASVAVKRITDRWVRLEADKVAIEQGCYFDRKAAEHVCEFFPTFLCHNKEPWAGKPFELLPWQIDYLSRLYGWKRPDGFRRFRETFLEIAKKNGKSTIFSGICLYGLSEEEGAEVFCGAVNKKQAGIIFEECSNMVMASPDLRRNFKVIPYTKTITFPLTHSKLVAMSADVEGQDGANATHVVLDETHRFKNRKLYDVMKYAGRTRKQPLLVNITTAGVDRNGLCYSLHRRAMDMIDGLVKEDVKFLPVVYAADPEKDDLDDPITWAKANPSLGVLFDVADFRSDFDEAKRLPGLLNNFLRLSLNIWTKQDVKWLDVDLWDAGKLDDPIDEAWMNGRSCYAAIDLSSVADLTALALLFVDGDNIKVVVYFFVPEETAERRGEVDKVPYPEWIEAGHIIATDGNATDHKAIRAKLNALAEAGVWFLKVGIDPWNASSLANDLADDGFDVELMRQGYATLTSPSKELERRLLAGTIQHDGNPVMAWCVANVATEQDAAGNIKPSKKKSTERIDGVVALVMTIGLAMAYPESTGPKVHSLK